jgi:hypothetical protein
MRYADSTTRPAGSVYDRAMDRTLFLLSPAHCGGRRAQLLLNGEASFPLAVRLRQSGAPLGEVFSFLSGLYFRGKLAYAEAFQEPDLRALVITPGRGLVLPGQWIRLEDLHGIAAVGVAADEPRFREPLERDLATVARELAPGDRVVLLGSIATGKYVDVLDAFVGERLHFPQEFVGRGDMSRGGLMLRCAAEERELDYVAVRGAVRRGARPPRLVRLP